ncbi:CCA tRNA nucleotidyltransferase [uncultured Secundilactobacillus sp.]|uniref:CCA tRNA nucleotidyltransferase n=1 Tax=uncultured Secundilactobacillus sp. TaxID=2813935 RepID=UPI002588EFFA|nr:CCA tRNA nucleotidyltransferase [uncultured Secundilactobacillus sp.]
MKIGTLPTEFVAATPILETIEAAGYEAYFVGGSVRDTLLGLPIHDVDIATSAYPQEVKQLFKKTVDTGIEHGTVMILDHGTGYETTTFRTETGYQDYRRPDSVTFVRSLREDLKRRDFTINALAMTHDGEIIDYFNGLGDLKAKRIKAVGNPEERFHEDALRTMRAIRFASQLDFTIDPQTVAAIQHHGNLLTKIAVERIHVEFVKLFLGKHPANGLTTFVETGLYQYCPGLATAREALAQLIPALQHGLSSETTVWTLIASAVGLTNRQVGSFLKQWKSANQLISDVTAAVRFLEALQAGEVTHWVLYQAGAAHIKTAAEVANILQIDTPSLSQLLDQYETLTIKSKQDLAISGQDLIKAGVAPGPKLGQLLTKLEREVVAGNLDNDLGQLLNQALKD